MELNERDKLKDDQDMLRPRSFSTSKEKMDQALRKMTSVGNFEAVWMLLCVGATDVRNGILISIKHGHYRVTALLLVCHAIFTENLSMLENLLKGGDNYADLVEFLPTEFSVYHEIRKSLKDKEEITKVAIQVARGSKKDKATEIVRCLLLNTDCDKVHLKKVNWRYLQLETIHESWLEAIEAWVRDLNLTGNNLTTLPTTLFNMKSLTRLNLSANNLEEIASEIFALPNLNNLNISRNNLCVLPEFPEMNFAIKSLNVSNNKLKTLPQSMVRSSLEILNLSNNCFTEVPLCVCEIMTLQELDLSDNREISSLPDMMGKLRNLYHLGLKHLDKITDPPKQLQQDAQDVVSTLRTRLRAYQRCYTMKLMLVGKSDQGKTTLLHRLRDDFSYNSSDLTQGIEVSDLAIKKSAFDKKFNFKVWDFGGQENDYAQCFLSTMSLYLLVWRLIDEEEGVKGLTPWLDNIAARSPGSTVIIVGTHLDCISPQKYGPNFVDHLMDKVYQLSRKPRYKGKIIVPPQGICAVSCLSTSSKSRSDINRLRHIIYDTAATIKKGRGPFMGEQIPSSFFSLSERIKKRKMEMVTKKQPPIIRREEFHAMVKENSLQCKDIEDPHDVRDATVFLRERGVVVHFDDPNDGLNDLYFIDPSWLGKLTAGLVRIRNQGKFTEGTVEVQQAIVFFEDIFPIEFLPQMIRLVISFQMVYPLDQSRILVPSKLPERKPEEVEKLSLPFVPVRRVYKIDCQRNNGFITRFMSRLLFYMREMISMHPASEDQHKDSAKFCRSCAHTEDFPGTFPCFLERIKPKNAEIPRKDARRRASMTDTRIRSHDDSVRFFVEHDPTVKVFTEEELKEDFDDGVIGIIINDLNTGVRSGGSTALSTSPLQFQNGYLVYKRQESIKRAAVGLRIPSYDDDLKSKDIPFDGICGDPENDDGGSQTDCFESPAACPKEKLEAQESIGDRGNASNPEKKNMQPSYQEAQVDDGNAANKVDNPWGNENKNSDVTDPAKSQMSSVDKPPCHLSEKKQVEDDAVYASRNGVDKEPDEPSHDEPRFNISKETQIEGGLEYHRENGVARSADLVPSNGESPGHHSRHEQADHAPVSQTGNNVFTSEHLVPCNDEPSYPFSLSNGTQIEDGPENHTVDGPVTCFNQEPLNKKPSFHSYQDTQATLKSSNVDIVDSSVDLQERITKSKDKTNQSNVLTNTADNTHVKQGFSDDNNNDESDNSPNGSQDSREISRNSDLNLASDIPDSEAPKSRQSTSIENVSSDGKESHATIEKFEEVSSDRLNNNFSGEQQLEDQTKPGCQLGVAVDQIDVSTLCPQSVDITEGQSSSAKCSRGNLAENTSTGTDKCLLCEENVPVDQLVTIPLDVALLMEKNFLKCWRSGICLNHPNVFLAVSCSSLSDTLVIQSAVSCSPLGRRLLTFVVDHLDSLIKEWYPGLLISFGAEPTIQKLIPCRLCEKSGVQVPYEFTLDSCVTQYSAGDFVKCPQHQISIQDIAPDVVLQDLDSRLLLDENEVHYDKTNELGKGAFGAVYRGFCRGKPVAIKEFSGFSGQNDDPIKQYREIRKEINVMKHIGKHPFLVNLIGVCLRPFRLVLELAGKGSLADILTDRDFFIDRIVVYRMIHQVADALSFLHSLDVIYRDLKPGNVLVMSYDEQDEVNIKLTDFGTASFKFLEGLVSVQGTPGYHAPEMLTELSKRIGYNNKVDVFSLGMLVYSFITRRKPFCNVASPPKINTMIRQGKKPEYHDVIISRIGLLTLTWLMEKCLEFDPNLRPTSKAIATQVRVPSFQLLLGMTTLPTSRSVRQVCIVEATRELWVAVSDISTSMVLIYELKEMTIKKEFTVPTMSSTAPSLCFQVTCMHVTKNSVLIGLCGDLELVTIHDMKTYQQKAKVILKDAVFCLGSNDSHIFLGMSNGLLCIIPTTGARPETVQVSDDPICSMMTVDRYLWMTSKKSIFIYSTEPGICTHAFELEAIRYSLDTSSVTLAATSQDKKLLWCACKASSVVTCWDVEKRKEHCRIECDAAVRRVLANQIPTPVERCVTCIALALDTVWVGTGGGMLLVFDAQSGDLVTWMHLFDDCVRTLTLVSEPGPYSDGSCYVVATGRHCRDVALTCDGNVVCSLVPECCNEPEKNTIKKMRAVKKAGSFSKLRKKLRRRKPETARNYDSNAEGLLLQFEVLPADVLRRIEAKSPR